MMKKNAMRVLLLWVVVLLSTFQLNARDKKTSTIYVFAYGICFNDSVVYLSGVERVSGDVVDGKTNFLNNRSAYSSAFKRYLDGVNGKTHTCAVLFKAKREKLEKIYLKIKRDTQKRKDTRFVEIPVADFCFSDVMAKEEQK